jgi:hypothetical protein
VALGRCGDGGAGNRGCGNAGESESGKLPHENILQKFAIFDGTKIYAVILNGRLLRLRIDLDHFPSAASTTEQPSSVGR